MMKLFLRQFVYQESLETNDKLGGIMKKVNIRYGDKIIATYQKVGICWTGIYQNRDFASFVSGNFPYQFSSYQELRNRANQLHLSVEENKAETV